MRKAPRSSTSAASRHVPGRRACRSTRSYVAWFRCSRSLTARCRSRSTRRRPRSRGERSRRCGARQRRDGVARGSGARRRRRRVRGLSLLHAHARQAAHDAGDRRATTTSCRTSRRSSRNGSRQPLAPASRRSGSASIPASASARPSSTTSSCCGVSTSSSRWGGLCSWECRASALSAGCSAIRTRRWALWPPACGSRLPSPRRCDDPPRARRRGGSGADGGRRVARMITIELQGSSCTATTACSARSAQGQAFLVDVSLDVAEPRADRIEDTLDYRDVAACVAEVSGGTRAAARVARSGGRRRADGALPAGPCPRPSPEAGRTARPTGGYSAVIVERP